MKTFRTNDFRQLACGDQLPPCDPAHLAKAVDPQPETTAYLGLDHRRWLGDGRRRWGTSRSDVVHDNTLHAGLALAALNSFVRDFLGPDKSARQAAEQAVHVYRVIARLPKEEEFVAVVQELICGVLHLMDARGIELHPARADNTLQTLLGMLLFTLEDLCRDAWADRLGASFEDILTSAREHYRDQVVHAPAPSAATR